MAAAEDVAAVASGKLVPVDAGRVADSGVGPAAVLTESVPVEPDRPDKHSWPRGARTAMSRATSIASLMMTSTPFLMVRRL